MLGERQLEVKTPKYSRNIWELEMLGEWEQDSNEKCMKKTYLIKEIYTKTNGYLELYKKEDNIRRRFITIRIILIPYKKKPW